MVLYSVFTPIQFSTKITNFLLLTSLFPASTRRDSDKDTHLHHQIMDASLEFCDKPATATPEAVEAQARGATQRKKSSLRVPLPGDDEEKVTIDQELMTRRRHACNGRFLTMHKRSRKKLTTRTLSQDTAILDDIHHGLVQCILNPVHNWRFNAFALETVTGNRQ